MAQLNSVQSIPLSDSPRKEIPFLETVDPSTGDVFSRIPSGDTEELFAIITQAKGALPEWQTRIENRRSALSRCAQSIDSRASELALLITKEQGKPLREAEAEVAYAAQQFREYAVAPLPERILGVSAQSHASLHFRPIGIIALITPWNFPLGTAAVKLAPALLMGNVAIFKPSERTPSAPLLLSRILNEHLPPGVLNTIAGSDGLGEEIMRHPDIGKISLTGSINTGRRAMSAAAFNLKRLTLELGGNDPAIVLPDADPNAIAQDIIDSAFRNAGQVCNSIKRLYVHESLAAELCSLITKKLIRLKIGPGEDPKTQLGPMSHPAGLARLDSLVRDSLEKGGRLHCGGKRLARPGFFFAPTLISGLANGIPLVDEEQFGPALPVISYSDFSEAIEMANDSPYGLSASVWTKDIYLGNHIAQKLQCGRVGINGHKRGDISSPFGGFKQSGLGRELGEWGLCSMGEMQVINVFEK